jgi:hypothetical protein
MDDDRKLYDEENMSNTGKENGNRKVWSSCSIVGSTGTI